MSKQLGILAGLALLLVLGCGTVMSLQPVGSEPLALETDEWEGTWNGAEDSIEIRVVGAAAGQLEVAWIESSAEGFSLETVEVHLRKAGDSVLASTRESAEDDEFALLLVGKDDHQIVLW